MSTDEDILEEEEEGEELVESVARRVGAAIASVSTAIRRAAAGGTLRAPVPKKRTKNVALLLRNLGEVVAAAREGDGWESLEHDPEFWRLIAQLSRAPRRARFDRGREQIPPGNGHVIDVDIDADEPSSTNPQFNQRSET